MIGMVHLDDAAILGRCDVHPPWRGHDGGKGARWPGIVNIVIWHSILRSCLTNNASKLRPRHRRRAARRCDRAHLIRAPVLTLARRVAPRAGASSFGPRVGTNRSAVTTAVAVAFRTFGSLIIRRDLLLALVE